MGEQQPRVESAESGAPERFFRQAINIATVDLMKFGRTFEPERGHELNQVIAWSPQIFGGDVASRIACRTLHGLLVRMLELLRDVWLQTCSAFRTRIPKGIQRIGEPCDNARDKRQAA